MITFSVIGTPKPQGSKRAYINRKTGHAIITDARPEPLKDWRTTVQQTAITHMDGAPPLDGPLQILLVFQLPRPKSHPKTRVTWPAKRPDIDKLVRAVLDALTHVCFVDDGQIVALHAHKRWGTPGVQVRIDQAWQ